MKKNLRSFMLKAGLAFSVLFFAGNVISQTINKDYIDGEIWFRLKSDKIVVQSTPIKNDRVSNSNNIKLSSMPYLRDVFTKHSIISLSKPFPKAYGSEDLLNTYHIQFADIKNVETFIRELEESGAVVYAEKVPLMQLDLTPNDPLHNTSNMWGLFQIQAEQAWNIGTGSSSIVVAVADNTVEIGHSDLTNVIWTNTGEIPGNGIDDDNNGFIDDVNGWDAGGTNASNDPDGNINVPSSSWNHGTHCAGTVGAETNNNNGLSSIGFGVSVMPIKCTHDGASSTAVTNGYDGIYYAAVNNADVISCSWGGTGFSSTAQNMINWATNTQGCIVVAAAGNDGIDNDVTPHYPSSYTNTVSVASTTTNDVKSSFSNYGTNSIDISAPGSNIASTIPFNQYSFMSGTSMATPMVSGLLGLMKSLNPAITNAALLNCLYTTADNIDSQNPSYIGKLGAGRINAFQAMNCVAATLSNPPVAQFSSNITTVTAGGSVTFTDQSTFGPTTWSWNFDNQSLGGVTPATANTQGPHIVTYNNPGVYEVSLTVTNANGSDTETKTAYITVTPPGSCNELNVDTAFSSPSYGHMGWRLGLYYAPNPGDYISGSNQFGDRASAEYFPSSVVGANNQFVEGVYFITGNLDNATNPTVTLNVWDATGGSPTATVLGSRTFNLADLNANTIYYRAFSSPIPLPTSSEIAVGFDFSNLNPAAGDTFTVFTNRLGQPSNSTGFNQSSSGTWTSYINQYSNNLSHYIFPQLTASPATINLSAMPTTICEGDLVNYDATGSTYQDTLLWSFPGMTPSTSNNVMDSIIYTTAGTYRTYLEVVGGGCSNYKVDSVDITVNPKPIPNVVVTPSDTICNGNSVTLSASGGGTYLWTPGGQTTSSINLSPTSNTSYSVAVTNSGCTGEESRTIYVENSPTANATFSPSSGVCVNDNVNFDGTSSVDANSYSWTFPVGSPSSGTSNSPFPVISFGANGTHNYSLVVQNKCGTDTHNGTVTVNICTGIEDVATNELNIYPNPTNNVINITGLEDVQQLSILDITGKVVYNNKIISTNNLSIDISEASKGLYFLQIKTANGIDSYKIVKQ